jgi:hypothetical protein
LLRVHFLFQSYPLRESYCITPRNDSSPKKKSDFSFTSSGVYQHCPLQNAQIAVRKRRKTRASKCVHREGTKKEERQKRRDSRLAIRSPKIGILWIAEDLSMRVNAHASSLLAMNLPMHVCTLFLSHDDDLVSQTFASVPPSPQGGRIINLGGGRSMYIFGAPSKRCFNHSRIQRLFSRR